jgi:hypothetical protein
VRTSAAHAPARGSASHAAPHAADSHPSASHPSAPSGGGGGERR